VFIQREPIAFNPFVTFGLVLPPFPNTFDAPINFPFRPTGNNGDLPAGCNTHFIQHGQQLFVTAERRMANPVKQHGFPPIMRRGAGFWPALPPYCRTQNSFGLPAVSLSFASCKTVFGFRYAAISRST